MAVERRTSYRILLRDSPARALDPTSSDVTPVRILNSSGGALAGWGRGSRHVRQQELRFDLGEHGCFDAEVQLLGPAAEAGDLEAFRFQSLSGSALGTLSRFLCSQHAQAGNRLERTFSSRDATLVVDGMLRSRHAHGSAALALLRHYICDERSPFFLYDETSERTVPLERVRLIETVGAPFLRVSLPRETSLDDAEVDEYIVFCSDALAVTWFRSRIARLGSTDLLIRAPTKLFQGGFRGSRRIAPPWNHPVTATIENPHLYGEVIARPVSEFSCNGFAIDIDPSRDRLFPGQHLARVCLDLPSGTVEMQCVVRMCRLAQGPAPMSVGFEIGEFRSPEDHDRWVRTLIPCLFPRARIGDPQLVSDAWARLERSGYLELVEASERRRLRAPFFDDWTRQASHPGLRSRFVLSYHDGAPIGLTAANLIYPKTCLVHSGGIDKAVQGTGQVLDLYSAAFIFAHTMGEYCLALFDADKRTNAVLFERFVEQYHPKADIVFDRFALFKWHAGQPVAGIPHRLASTYDVVSADGKLMRILWERQQQTLSSLELDAYGFSPDGHCMQQFSERCTADGYARHRQIFFALRDGVPLAALIAETGSEGMNVFSLLNACSVFFLHCPADQRADVVRSLVLRAIDHYSGAGKAAFLFLGFGADEDHARLADVGLTYVARGWRWLVSKRVIPAYVTYLRDLAATRSPGAVREADRAGPAPSPDRAASPFVVSPERNEIILPANFTL